jgi:RimJ/RimL family protein N-acetyltransferase
MLREATLDDALRIDAFLARYADSSMYLRGNLAAHGVGFGENDHSTQFFLWEGEAVEGVFGITKSGYVMAQMPGMPVAAAQAFAAAIRGRDTLGMTGVADQVPVVLRALGIARSEFQLQHEEPLYRLDLNDLPEALVNTRPMAAADLERLEDWYARYFQDTGQADAAAAAKLAPGRARSDLQTGRVKLLEQDGVAVAMAALNAVVGTHVQVGGVFVPQDLRGRGFAQKITVGLLQAAQREGAETAVLFANNPVAARTYEAIGFQQVGWYGIALLAKPEKVLP